MKNRAMAVALVVLSFINYFLYLLFYLVTRNKSILALQGTAV